MYKEMGDKGPLTIRGDSKLVIEQMKGNWQAREGAYLPLYHRLKKLVAKCEFEIQWEWIPRNQNKIADALSVKALEEHNIRRKNP